MLKESSSFKEILIELHTEALKLSREYRKVESDLVRVLNENDLKGLYRVLGYSSLFTYIVSALGLSESVAYALITVARKAREIEALGEALAQGRISVPRASRSALVGKCG